MFGFLERIKKLFSRKKENAQEEQPAETQQEQQETIPEIKERAKRRAQAKTCPHCNSPNDIFVHKCWLCKNEI